MKTKLYSSIVGLALCGVAFYLGYTFQFGAFVSHLVPCVQNQANSFPCSGYHDINIMILSIVVGVALVLRIAHLLHTLRIAAIVMTTLYSAILFKMIVFKYPFGHAVFGSDNFIPFKTILTYLSGHPTWTIAVNNLVGNLLPFILLGLLLPFTMKQPLKATAVAGMSLTIGALMEITQALLQMGIFDIDDIILNALGITIGYLLVTTIMNYTRKTTQLS
jgi:glycopeptide antibiotics resistance protein